MIGCEMLVDAVAALERTHDHLHDWETVVFGGHSAAPKCIRRVHASLHEAQRALEKTLRRFANV